MENLNKRKREVKTAYTKWNHAEKSKLIQIRIKYDAMFTGKNANQRDGWKKISEELKRTSTLCRQQWQALIRKYKLLTQKNSGDGMGDEAPEGDVGPSITWPYFDAIHKYASAKDNFYPPHLSCNVGGIIGLPHNAIIDEEITVSDDESPSPDFRSTPTPHSSNSSRSRNSNGMPEDQMVKETKKIYNKISAAMTIFGQMVQQEFPNIDVSALLVSESEDSS